MFQELKLIVHAEYTQVLVPATTPYQTIINKKITNMKKSLLILSLLFGVFSQMWAGDRTEQQMKEAAAKALMSHVRRAASTSELKELKSLPKLKIFGYDEGGFAVVTTDDRFDEVIGYSSSKFSDVIPCGFKWWMESAEEVMENSDSRVIISQRRANNRASRVDISPMITTTWGQERPFNDNCTFSNNGHTYQCVTGCAATAMAQVMNYHRYPEKGTGSVSYNIHYNNNAFTITFAEDFSQSVYDWGNMLDNYSSYYGNNVTDAHTIAVAKLMKDCGVSIKTNYSDNTHGSSASLGMMKSALQNYFYYSSDTKYYNRSSYTGDWMDLIYGELRQGRPVVYGAQDSKNTGGHGFIIHGYDASTGQVYVNWGWDGHLDGYYDIELLNPQNYSYNKDQELLTVVPTVGQPVVTTKYNLSITSAGNGSVTYNGNTISNNTSNYSIDEGSSVTISISPNNGYRIKSVIVNNTNVTSQVYNYQYTISSINQNTTVTIEFEQESQEGPTDKYNSVLINGIYFNLIGGARTAEVTSSPSNNYSGSITIPESVEYKGFTYQVTQIGEKAFYQCYNLTSVSIPNSVITIGNSAFSACFNLLSINLPNSIQDIGGHAFANCNNLASITLPDGITILHEGTFAYCKGLKSIKIPDTVTALECTLTGVFYQCTALESIFLSSNTTSIGNVCFYKCTSLTSIVIPDKVTTIGSSAFYGCSNLNSVTIGKSVTNIYSKAFAECKSFESVVCLAENAPTANSDAFENSYIENVTLFVPDASLNSYKSVTPWNLFETVKGISEYAPNSQQPASQTAEINGIYYILVGKSRTAEVTSSPSNNYSGSITIPESVEYKGFTYQVTQIGEKAFYQCYNLTSVSIPNSVITIGNSAFSACFNLLSINLPNSIQDIGGHAFANCNNLASITLPDGITILHEGTFAYCKGLKSIKIPDTVTALECTLTGVFYQCTALESIFLSSNTTSIGNVCFYKCTSLTSIVIPDKVTTIGSSAFYGCSNLNSVTIGKSVTNIYSKAFAECKSLESVVCMAENAPTANSNAFENSYIEHVTLYVPENSVDKYKTQEPWNKFGQINPFSGSIKYTLTYKVDGAVYKTYQLEAGSTITPEPAPTKEGYTFSGWSDIPQTMPNHDVTVNGTFTINKYKLTYMVDGSEYKSYDIEYGASITLEVAPTKEGYTFSGWSDIPSTMPAQDVTVTGTFTVNKYTLTYMVDGDAYKTYEIEYGARITPEAEPTKEGYAFSGWSEIPQTMPAHDVTVTGTFTKGAYKLIYMVDGEVYKTVSYDYGETITPEAEPTKEGYTFSGWSNIPTTMPANDVTVTGTFTVNKYKLTYMVDGEVYKSYDVEYGATITPEAEPTKEGYSFSGWSDIPQTMPAHDVTVTGSFTYAPPKAYTLTYMVDGEVYKTVSYYAGDAITPEAEPTKDGYTFSGWSEIPAKMPAHDVEVTGTFNYILIEGTVHDIAVCNNNYVLCFDDWDNNGTNRCGKGVLFGDGFFLDVSGGAVATNKGTVNLSVVNSDDDNHVTQYIADRYGSDYPNDHFNSWRLKNQQDMIAMKVTAHSKLIFFLQGNNKSGVNARIPKIFDGSRDIDSIYEGEALNDAPDAGFPSTSSGFRYEWIAPKDMLIYIGSYNGDMYLSYLIVETNESSQLSKYHTLSYYVDGKVYRTYVLTENKTINPEAAPTKDGYSFSGWSGLPQTMPDHDVIVTGSFTKGAYKLIYMVDGEVYKTVSYDYGETITPEAEPTKEGYTFSGWSNIPTTMPANDVTVTGTFTVNKYKLTYMVDGEVYKSYDVEYGATITPEAEPTKEGYKFSGWSYIPNKMPAEDVTVVGTFTQEAFVKDNVTYEINGNEASVTHADNAKGEIVIEASVVINGKSYNVTSIADGAFQGCTGLTSIEIPATVTSIGENAFNGCSSLIIIKIGKDIKEIGSKAFANIGKSNAKTRAEEIMLKVYCEAEVLPSTAGDAFENSPIAKGILYVNDDLVGVYKVVMPWNGFGTIVGLSTGIKSVSIDSEDAWIFDMQGNRIDNVRKGVNIIRTRDGKTKKIVVK